MRELKKGKSVEIVRDILKKIKNSILKVGDRLPSERSLAKEYGVSRIVIREVVSYLKAIGVIESIQGSGNYIISSDISSNNNDLDSFDMYYDIDELIEARRIMEKTVASMVLNRMDPYTIADLERLMKRYETAVKNQDLENIILCDIEFHRIYASMVPNAILMDVLSKLLEYMKGIIWRNLKKEYLFSELYNKISLENHKRIFNALKDRDLKQLLESIDRHYDSIVQGLGSA